MDNWFVKAGPDIRSICYLLACVFYLIWGIYAIRATNYHRGVIKILTFATLASFIVVAVTRNPWVTAYISTPLLIALAVAASTFMIRLILPDGAEARVKKWIGSVTSYLYS